MASLINQLPVERRRQELLEIQRLRRASRPTSSCARTATIAAFECSGARPGTRYSRDRRPGSAPWGSFTVLAPWTDGTAQRRQGGLDGLRGLAALAGVRRPRLDLPAPEHASSCSRDNLGELAAVRGARRVRDVLRAVRLPALPAVRPRGARRGASRSGPSAYFVRRAARIMPAYYVALAGTLVLIATAGDVAGQARGRRARAAAVPRLRPELHARHAAEAERRDLDAGDRGGLLPPAAADRAARAASAAAAARAGRSSCSRSLVMAGLALEPGRLRRRLGPGREPLAAVVPALLRLRHAGRAGGRAQPRARSARGSARARATLALPARRRSCWSPTAIWHANDATPDGFADRDVRRPPGGDRVRGGDRGDRARHGRGPAAGSACAAAGLVRPDLLRLLPLAHPADRVGARPRPARRRRAARRWSCCCRSRPRSARASWYVVERPLMNRAARLRRDADAERSRPRPAHLSAARRARSRWRTRGRSATPPASSSGRAAARATVTGTSLRRARRA